MPTSLGLGSPYKTQSSRGKSLMPPTQPRTLLLTEAFRAFIQVEHIGFRIPQEFQRQVCLHSLSYICSTRQHIQHLSFSRALPGGLLQSKEGPRALEVHVVLEGPLLPSWRRVCLSLVSHSGESGHLCLAPDLRERLSVFPH